jgi:hypothetical protein
VTRASHIAVLASLAFAFPATSADAKLRRCDAKPGVTVLRTGSLRVFQRVHGTVDDGQTVRVFVCRRTSRAVRQIDSWNNDLDGILSIAAARVGGGRWPVLSLDELGGISSSWDVFAYDLHTSKRTFTFAQEYGGPKFRGQMVVTHDGGVAMLFGTLVRAYDARGGRVLEPSGATELEAHGNVVSWSVAATRRSAALVGHPESDDFVSPPM